MADDNAPACPALAPAADRRHAAHGYGGAPMSDDPVKDAQDAVARAIAELKAANVAIPVTLHRAAHALSYAMAQR
jgi:hypothetical protein